MLMYLAVDIIERACACGSEGFFPDESAEPGEDRDPPDTWPGTAEEGVKALADDWASFRAHIEALGDKRLIEPMGSRASEFAHESYVLLALHALDEAAHHGGELGVLRDLYLWKEAWEVRLPY